MGVTRFEALPKKDREFVETFVASRPDLLRPVEHHSAEAGEIFRAHRQGLRDRPDQSGYAYNSSAQLFAGDCLFLSSTLVQRGIALRLLNDEVQELISATTAAGRLAYIEILARDPQARSEEGLLTEGVSHALAAGDWEAATAFVRRYPSPSRKEHVAGRNIWNRIAQLILPTPEIASVLTKPVPKLSTHALAAVEALDGILAQDATRFLQALAQVLDNHVRVEVDGGLRRHHPVLAYALFRLAERTIDLPRPTHRIWDDQFYAASPAPFDWNSLAAFSRLAPGLARDLPPVVDPILFDED